MENKVIKTWQDFLANEELIERRNYDNLHFDYATDIELMYTALTAVTSYLKNSLALASGIIPDDDYCKFCAFATFEAAFSGCITEYKIIDKIIAMSNGGSILLDEIELTKITHIVYDNLEKIMGITELKKLACNIINKRKFFNRYNNTDYYRCLKRWENFILCLNQAREGYDTISDIEDHIASYLKITTKTTNKAVVTNHDYLIRAKDIINDIVSSNELKKDSYLNKALDNAEIGEEEYFLTLVSNKTEYDNLLNEIYKLLEEYFGAPINNIVNTIID